MKQEDLDTLPQKMQDTYKYYCVTEDIQDLSMDSIILAPALKLEVDKFRAEFEHREEFYDYK